MATTARKRTTTKRKPAPKVIYKTEPTPTISLPDIGFREMRWDPRITLYVTPKEAKNYIGHASFTIQQRGPFTFDGFKFTELGAFHEDLGDKRIVLVEPV